MNILRSANNIKRVLFLRENEEYISCIVPTDSDDPVTYSKNISIASRELKRRMQYTKKICIFKEDYIFFSEKVNGTTLSLILRQNEGLYFGIFASVNGQQQQFTQVKSASEDLYEFFIKRIIDINHNISSSVIEIGGNLYYSQHSI